MTSRVSLQALDVDDSPTMRAIVRRVFAASSHAIETVEAEDAAAAGSGWSPDTSA